MPFNSAQPYLTGIEIGTSTIKVLIARMGTDMTLDVVGFGEVPSLKMCKGEALNARIVTEQVVRAMAQARSGLDEDIDSLYFFALSGSFIESFCLTGKIDFEEREHLISQEDFETAARATNTYQPPEDKFHLQSLVNRIYRLGDGRTILNPIGQSSPTLEVEIQHFIADISRANTTCSLLNGVLGQPLDSLMYTPLTLGAALLKEDDVSDEDMPLLIDIGAGLTSVAVPTSVGHLHCSQIAVGCEHIANDISLAFGLPIQSARLILNQLGNLHCTAVATHDGQARIVNCELPSRHEQRLIPASSLEMVVEARLQELFEIIRQQLEDQQVMSWIGKRVLLSGGGALIPRVAELASRVFNRPQIEIARPFDICGKADFTPLPQYVTVIGLIRAGYRDYLTGKAAADKQHSLGKMLKHVWTVVSDW